VQGPGRTLSKLGLAGAVWSETILYTFLGFKGDATTPATTLALDPSGNLYGTSVFGGSTPCYLGCWTILKLAPPSGSHVDRNRSA
jgi:hypothetical protein